MCADELTQALNWVGQHFPFLTPEQFLGGEQHGVLVTFDDGLANNYDVALPILETFEVPAIFFVTTQHVGNPSDWLTHNRRAAERVFADGSSNQLAGEFYDGLSAPQLRACSKHQLITIGSHTVSHPYLTKLDAREQTRELAESKLFLESITGKEVLFLAYPFGDYDRRVLCAVKAVGYKAAFVENSRYLEGGAFEIPRIGLYGHQPAYLSAKLSGLHQPALHRRFVEE